MSKNPPLASLVEEAIVFARCSPRGVNASIGAGGGGGGMRTACGHPPGSARDSGPSGLLVSGTVFSTAGEGCLGGVAKGSCPISTEDSLRGERKLGTDAWALKPAADWLLEAEWKLEREGKRRITCCVEGIGGIAAIGGTNLPRSDDGGCGTPHRSLSLMADPIVLARRIDGNNGGGTSSCFF